MGRKRKNPEDDDRPARVVPVAESAPVEFNPIAQYYQSWALGKAQASAGASAGQEVDGDIQEMCDNFHIEDRHTKNLNLLMQKRVETFEADMLRLWTDLERAHNPNGLLVVQMRQMDEGTFIGKNKPDPEYVAIVKKYNLDEQAEEKLLDTLSRHPIERRKEYYKELDPFLAASNKASATAMMLLRKVGEGESLGPPPRAKGGGKDKDKSKDGKGEGSSRDDRDGRGSDNRDRDRDSDRRDDRDRGGSGRDGGWQDKSGSDRDRRDWSSRDGGGGGGGEWQERKW